MLFSLGKWMAIFALNLLWSTDAHDLQGISMGFPVTRIFEVISCLH
jgi:hypothetical protein